MRGTARGDHHQLLVAKIGLPFPPTFSQTVKPLTFAFTILQMAIALLGLIWSMADIKAAYLNVSRPSGQIPILTKLESFIAEVYGLDNIP